MCNNVLNKKITSLAYSSRETSHHSLLLLLANSKNVTRSDHEVVSGSCQGYASGFDSNIAIDVLRERYRRGILQTLHNVGGPVSNELLALIVHAAGTFFERIVII